MWSRLGSLSVGEKWSGNHFVPLVSIGVGPEVRCESDDRFWSDSVGNPEFASTPIGSPCRSVEDTVEARVEECVESEVVRDSKVSDVVDCDSSEVVSEVAPQRTKQPTAERELPR